MKDNKIIIKPAEGTASYNPLIDNIVVIDGNVVTDIKAKRHENMIVIDFEELEENA